MTAVFVLSLLFLGVGLLARAPNVWTRSLLTGMIIVMILYISLS